MSFVKMKFFIAIILLAACAAVQGRSVQAHPITSMLDHRKDSRIIDGNYADRTLLPWHAYLVISGPSGENLCGGALISDQWVLTAAHCLTDATSVRVRMGGVFDYYMPYDEISNKFLIHENYVPSTHQNDVALIELPIKVVQSSFLLAVPLPARSDPDPAGSSVRVSGFGRTLEFEKSPILQWVDLIAMDNTECDRYYPGKIFPSTLCAHGRPHHSTCQGDEGGPLIHYNLHPILVGIVSFMNTDSCVMGFPSAYARVSSYLDWINQHTGIPIRD